MLGLDYFAILSRHPPHAAVDHNRMPAILCSSHPFKGVAVLGGGDAAVLRAVTGADVDRAADAGDCDLPAGGVRRFLTILQLGGLQRFVPVSGCRH